MSKRDNKIIGDGGERLAEAYFISKGYRILNKNYRTDIGEIDLIVTNETDLVFAEIKTRSGLGYGYPAEAVTFSKRKKISQVAAQYIKRFRLYDVPVRFDVVEVFIQSGEINHIEDAFDSYLKYC